MLIFEMILVLLFGAALLSMLARRINMPYPTFLALGGMLVAFVPGAPRLDLPPDLILALFVAPVLLDAAHDSSLRDLRDNWRPILSLVLVAVGLTTMAVAVSSMTGLSPREHCRASEGYAGIYSPAVSVTWNVRPHRTICGTW